ncbi:MAG TPA: universal stress protein [Gemmatimonadaceae bacterium]|jgi:nucleotide-binding universal stress UspA family protein|nr:universal stress protein [Gemmatimonadaceae bacterium]
MTEPHVATSTLTSGTDEEKRTGRPIVVATSGEDGTAALRAAELLASHTRSEVHVLSVIEPDPATPYDPQFGFVSPEYQAIRLDIRNSNVRRQAQSATAKGAEWPIDIHFGSAPMVIADEARRQDASLVIMDSGRHALIARLLAGETALRTIRRARTPVLAIVGDFEKLPDVAVAAIDFSPASIAAARAALDLLSDDATLYLVHVWSRSSSDHPSERVRDDAYERALPERFARAQAAMEVPPGITVHRITLLGDPVEEILSFAASQGAELIAAGRRGYGFFERLLVGSTTTALLRGAKCSVLVTPEPTAVEADALARAVTGVFESHAPDQWAAQLDGFSRRNRGRLVALEVDDPHTGTQLQAAGYALVGATYDHNDRSVQIMLTHPGDESMHLTHTMRSVTAVSVRSDQSGVDQALRIDHRDGWIVIRFAPADRPQRKPTAS